MKNKRVLVRVDFNVPVRDQKIATSQEQRIRAALPTIRKITDQGGRAILMSHMGRPTGHKYAVLRASAEKRRRYLQIWAEERGVGYTAFFSIRTGAEKMTILGWSSVADQSRHFATSVGAGKTDLFASLGNEEKKALLKRFQESEGMAAFPQLRQYGGFDDELTLRPVALRLAELLNDGPGPTVEVVFAADCLDADGAVAGLAPGHVLLLENVRFYSDEHSHCEAERGAMARKIAAYGDFYVSEAFGTCGRDSATVVGVPRVLGHGCCGYLMQQEMLAYATLLEGAPRPAVAIVGGVKVLDKLLLLEHLLTQLDSLVLVGGMAYTFLRAAGFRIGNSFHESGQSFGDKYGEGSQNVHDLAKNFLIKAQACNVEVLLPVDHICHTSCNPTETPLITDAADVPDGYMALDIGPRTVGLAQRCIARCRTAVWNGPAGVCELPTFATGSFSIARALGDGTRERGLLSIVAGGASAAAAQACGHATRVSHVSAGGGAALDLLEGKMLPGITALDDKHNSGTSHFPPCPGRSCGSKEHCQSMRVHTP